MTDFIKIGANGVANRPLEILVVGAGIGGLTAAIALRNQGHNVQVLIKPKHPYDNTYEISRSLNNRN